MPEGLRSYKLCSYKKKKRVANSENFNLFYYYINIFIYIYIILNFKEIRAWEVLKFWKEKIGILPSSFAWRQKPIVFTLC